MDSDSDLELRALRGDSRAWNDLITRHNHRVVVSLLARGVRIDRAKDVAQEAWLRLIERQREGKLEELRLPGLAIVQAGFLAADASRRDRKLSGFDDHEGVVERLADPRADAEAACLTTERLTAVRSALATCGASSRTVFDLLYGDPPRSHMEAALEVGLSLQRVRQIHCEVRKVLRAAVGSADGDDQ